MNRRQILAGTLAVMASTRARAMSHASVSSENRAERLIAAMGGRDRWASARGYEVEADHWLIAEAGPAPNRILFDFATPRLRIESTPSSGWRSRIIAGPRGWRIAPGDARVLTATEVADERSFWEANIYRTVHRLARRDPALSVTVDGEDRLMVDGLTGGPLWFHQNAAGAPVAFGPVGDAQGTIFGPLRVWDGLGFPTFSIRQGGRWRAIIRRFRVDPDLSDAALMAGIPTDLR